LINRFLEIIGRPIVDFVIETGRLGLLFFSTLFWMLRPPYRIRLLFKQMEEIGVNSVWVAAITTTFTGGILALQSYSSFKRFDAEALIGTMVAISMCRELSPILVGLIVAGRVGSSMAAELGSMRVTEQIDALYTLAVNPIQYLIVPRMLACFMMMPVLTLFGDILGIGGGFIVATQIYDLNPDSYIQSSFDFLTYEDVYSGLIKSSVFGIAIAIVSCYKGFTTEGGAAGVGKATTAAVVLSMILILIIDYIMGALFFSI
jgi:phospholipid/cholesterol/gamma-HCH transport system permease protein